ncbi:MAG: NADH-quinone oxidoreductase subunit A [Planctomycetaceae bacterium]|nr:NADH-quinone oxidoreductase subunit A [Planctomycetaceae bacterium]
MSPAIASSLGIVAYLALFAAVGIAFLFANLLVGRFLRPHDPHAEKLEIYECGEPTIGSSFVQFDLRFYVVALLFIIFDVEVAFFFPWAAAFGKAANLADQQFPVVARDNTGTVVLTQQARWLYQEFGIRNPTPPTTVPVSLAAQVPPGDDLARAEATIHAGARQLAWLTIVDIAAFFAVLMIGFAYVWKRGDLDWVRALSQERATAGPRGASDDPLEQEISLSL